MVFQQDGAPAHTALTAQNWLKKHVEFWPRACGRPTAQTPNRWITPSGRMFSPRHVHSTTQMLRP
ncbi:Transposable element tcb1 transposase [Caligus rogercresseyi]|uniref:Transposable element tcb1 transposase n=1 Tax=Caligus rogercresseyi TaxID=217165 RepID=A0A7T8KJA9_CALRO|nr:Transposable element tcb1 transposase [Caligus rogercresseyi]